MVAGASGRRIGTHAVLRRHARMRPPSRTSPTLVFLSEATPPLF